MTKYIEELHKPQEIGQFRQSVKDDGFHHVRDNLKRLLARYNFSASGSGVFATVFRHPSYPYVLKVFRKDSGFIRWFKFCRQHPDNPWLPKFKGGLLKIMDNIYAVRMEPLESMIDDNLNSINKPLNNASEFISDKAFGTGKYYLIAHLEDMMDSPFYNQNQNHIKPIISELKKSKFGWDMHRGNAMRRGDQLVFVDPYFSQEDAKLMKQQDNDSREEAVMKARQKLEWSSGRYRRVDELHKPKGVDEFRQMSDRWKKNHRAAANHILSDYGFDKMGHGIFGSVYVNLKYPYALKIFKEDSGYIKWFRFCKANQDNPFVPKVKGSLLKITDRIYAVRIEKLEKLPLITDNLKLNSLSKALLKIADMPYAEKHLTEPKLNALRNANPHLDKILDEFAHYFEMRERSDWYKVLHYSLDFHTGNVMLRGDQLVITDPFVGMER